MGSDESSRFSGQSLNAELDAQLTVIQKRISRQKLEVEQLGLEAERLEVQEQISQRAALAEGRLKTEQLQEARKQALLIEAAQPPPPQVTPPGSA
jgi:hypothetical protein